MSAPPFGLVVTRPTLTATLDLIARAERHGVPTVWSSVGGTNPDAFTLFAAAATRTDRILLGTAIVPIYPRHPLALASQALVLADLAPGRLRLLLSHTHSRYAFAGRRQRVPRRAVAAGVRYPAL